MEQIIIDFKSECKNNPHLGEIINFSSVVGYMNYPRPLIKRAFDRLVPKNNYMQKDYEDLIDGLFVFSGKTRVGKRKY